MPVIEWLFMWSKLISVIGLSAFLSVSANAELADDPSKALVTGHCTGCHSANLITQNRMNRSGWKKTIVWMQKNHGLWELGEAETSVLDYLTTHYNVPKSLGSRRQALNQPPLP